MSTQTAPTSETGQPVVEGRELGWLYFSGTVLGLAGLMRILDGIWALRHSEKLQDGLLGDNLKNYGWLWLFVGLALVLSSFLVLTKNQLARWVGIVAASIMTVSAVVWLPYYPIASMLYAIIGFFALYGLIAYGGNEF